MSRYGLGDWVKLNTLIFFILQQYDSRGSNCLNLNIDIKRKLAGLDASPSGFGVGNDLS